MLGLAAVPPRPGIGLVVKNGVRWAFLGSGACAFLAGTTYLFMVPGSS